MYITVDVGSTNIRIAGSRDLENLTEPVIKRTPQEYSEGIAHIADTAGGIAQGESIDAIAIGIPARLTLDRRGLYKNRNLPDWDGRMIADDLEKTLSTRAYLENDTMQVGQGEAVFGAGKGSRIVVYMTVSTGVNAVRVVDGKIEPSVYGYETGFQYLSTDENPVDLMDLIAGRAVAEKYGKHPKELGKDNPVWEELARTTAIGLHNTVLHWSPDKVVLGGSMFNDIGISVDRVQFHLKTIMKAFPTIPEIVHSSLGDIGGLWGGLALLRQGYEGQARLKQLRS
mgnify:CR=1 FL=1